MANKQTPDWFNLFMKGDKNTKGYMQTAKPSFGASLGTGLGGGVSQGILADAMAKKAIQQALITSRLGNQTAYLPNGTTPATDKDIINSKGELIWKPNVEQEDFKTKVLKLAQDTTTSPELKTKLWDVLGVDMGKTPGMEHMTVQQQQMKEIASGSYDIINKANLERIKGKQPTLSGEEILSLLSDQQKWAIDELGKQAGYVVPTATTQSQPITSNPGALQSFFNNFGKIVGKVGASAIMQRVGQAGSTYRKVNKERDIVKKYLQDNGQSTDNANIDFILSNPEYKKRILGY